MVFWYAEFRILMSAEQVSAESLLQKRLEFLQKYFGRIHFLHTSAELFYLGSQMMANLHVLGRLLYALVASDVTQKVA